MASASEETDGSFAGIIGSELVAFIYIMLFLSLFISFLAYLTSALALQYASRQPFLPQPHVLPPILIIELTVLLQAIITGAVAVTVIVNRILRRTPDGLRDINDQDDKKRGCRRGAYRRGFGGDAVGLYRLYCVLRC